MPGRNDPCPCGSGKKYKKCCWRKDQEARSERIDRTDRREPAPWVSDLWYIDLLPLPIYLDDAPEAHPATLLVVSGTTVLYSDLVRNAPGEVEEQAQLFEDGLRKAMGREGSAPEAVLLLYPELVEALEPKLRAEGIEVERTYEMPELDAAGMAMHRRMGESRLPYRLASPQTWAGWGLPEETVAELHRAYASFQRASLLEILPGSQTFFAETREGREWTLVLVELEEGYSFSAYKDLRDHWDVAEAGDAVDPGEIPRAPVFRLASRDAADMSEPAREEARRAAWELASPREHPVLVAQGTPGGSIRRADAQDLVDLLWTLPRFVQRFGRELEDGRARAEPLQWTDPQTGATLRCWNSLMPEAELIVDPPERLTPCLPEGPNAQPSMALWPHFEDEQHDLDREAALEGFETWLRAGDLPAEEVAEARATAETYATRMLASAMQVPLCAQTAYDLRYFLYEWYALHARIEDEGRASRLLGDLRLFFRYLEQEEELRCPWAAELLADEESFLRRWRSFPGWESWDEGLQIWRVVHQERLAELELLCESLLEDEEREELLAPGPEETRLLRDLHRRWLAWRDEAIAAAALAGEPADPARVGARCRERQAAWETEPHDFYEDATPAQVLREERAERAAWIAEMREEAW